MAYPKMKPCPKCNDTTNLDVFTYENGARHVECVKCNYLGPACTSILWAIRHHNNEQDQRAEAHRAALKEQADPHAEAKAYLASRPDRAPTQTEIDDDESCGGFV